MYLFVYLFITFPLLFSGCHFKDRDVSQRKKKNNLLLSKLREVGSQIPGQLLIPLDQFHSWELLLGFPWLWDIQNVSRASLLLEGFGVEFIELEIPLFREGGILPRDGPGAVL